MNIDYTPKNKPIIPCASINGRIYRCLRCWKEVNKKDKKCPNCGQVQDWSWFGNSK